MSAQLSPAAAVEADMPPSAHEASSGLSPLIVPVLGIVTVLGFFGWMTWVNRHRPMVVQQAPLIGVDLGSLLRFNPKAKKASKKRRNRR